jgi:hypothetical protein
VKRPVLRWLFAGTLGIALTLLLNVVGIWWLGATLSIGFLTRGAALNVAVVSFGLFCAVGFVHPLWRIPPVSPESAHSGGMHYFLHSPLVALAFGTLGAWLAAQFSTGKWTLADEQPVSPQE